jgi:hypothetical protein
MYLIGLLPAYASLLPLETPARARDSRRAGSACASTGRARWRQILLDDETVAVVKRGSMCEELAGREPAESVIGDRLPALS